jgi:membrane-associated phospholipid phosphatase
MLYNKWGLTFLLTLVFALNYAETAIEDWLKEKYSLGAQTASFIAVSFQKIEGNYSFENHAGTNAIAVYGFSISYFFLLPLLAVAIAVALSRRKEISAYRVLTLAVAFNYLISLPFFILFPVPERWTYADSGAILLSDLWSSKLIESIRPISGLDNSFPSFHVSMTTIIILICYLFSFRFRITTLALGTTVILSTFVLGIHWMADIVSGLAIGVLSVSLALRFDRSLLKRKPG